LSALALLAASPVARGATLVSDNWAGYVASPSASVGSRFSGVSGRWREPAIDCAAGGERFSAAWVGLGGSREGGGALEQVGTDADCTRSGRAVYAAWFELLPAAPTAIALKVRPGDELVASTTVRADRVTLRLRDLSTGARFSTTRRVRNPDVSTAEWIVEAPSECTSASTCSPLALADFGTLTFSSATATARGHTGTIGDAHWSAATLELQQRSGEPASDPSGRLVSLQRYLTRATPSAAVSRDGSFSVSFSERATGSESPAALSMPSSGVVAP
jgi:hypothetical protein